MKENKLNFEHPVIEVYHFDAEDVLTASGPNENELPGVIPDFAKPN